MAMKHVEGMSSYKLFLKRDKGWWKLIRKIIMKKDIGVLWLVTL